MQKNMQSSPSASRQVVSAIVQNRDKYLLIKRMNPPSKGMYAFPGGRVENGESLEHAVLRELIEETGLTGTYTQLYAQYDLTREGGSFALSVFKVSVNDVSGASAQDDAEDLGWYRISETASLKMPPSMVDCFTKLTKD